MAGSAFSSEHAQPGPPAAVNQPQTPEPRGHSTVCCCLLYEQHGTGEQSIRSSRGDYGQFLVSIRSAALLAVEPPTPHPTNDRKPSRTGDTAMRRREPARVLGPYPVNEQCRLAARLRMNLGARTVESTIQDWEAARLRSGGAYPATIAEQSAKVHAVLGSVLPLRLGDITERKAMVLYDKITTEPSKKTGLPLRAATHRYCLSLVQGTWKWAQKQGYVQHDPWAEIEPIGRVSAGKPQLRPAEARLFARLAEQEAVAGSAPALAALCCLSLGLRASEALSLTARDVDAEAGEVYVNGTKAAASMRRLQVPAHLVVLLGRAAAARPPFERLCRVGRQAMYITVVALCAQAGVPRVCVHGLRGTHASLAVACGAAVEAVARVLGHTSTKMTLGHYVTDEVATGARLAAVQSSLNPQKSFRDPFGVQLSDGEIESSVLYMLSTCRRAAARCL